jgi:hypothetical protein
MEPNFSEMARSMLEVLDSTQETLDAAAAKAWQSIIDDPKESAIYRVTQLSGESHAVGQMLYFLKNSYSVGVIPKEIPASPDDTVRTEFTVRTGRADIVVFHIDGTATVIEVKDGATGYRNIVAGIGQVSMYACQIGNVPGSIQSVRRALAWDACKDPEHNKLIADACRLSGVIPVKLLPKRKLVEMLRNIAVSRNKELLDSMARSAEFESFDQYLSSQSSLVSDLSQLVAELKALRPESE